MVSLFSPLTEDEIEAIKEVWPSVEPLRLSVAVSLNCSLCPVEPWALWHPLTSAHHLLAPA